MRRACLSQNQPELRVFESRVRFRGNQDAMRTEPFNGFRSRTSFLGLQHHRKNMATLDPREERPEHVKLHALPHVLLHVLGAGLPRVVPKRQAAQGDTARGCPTVPERSSNRAYQWAKPRPSASGDSKSIPRRASSRSREAARTRARAAGLGFRKPREPPAQTPWPPRRPRASGLRRRQPAARPLALALEPLWTARTLREALSPSSISF